MVGARQRECVDECPDSVGAVAELGAAVPVDQVKSSVSAAVAALSSRCSLANSPDECRFAKQSAIGTRRRCALAIQFGIIVA